MHKLITQLETFVQQEQELYDVKVQYIKNDQEYLDLFAASIKSYRKEQQKNLIQALNWDEFSWSDFELIRDFMQILRGYFLMNCSFATIPEEYQQMCAFFITLTLQKKALWANNFLKYFDSNSAYYNRIKALSLFRILKNPKKEIESKLQEISDLLYLSVQKEPESFPKALNILKEYLENVFALTRKTVPARVDFVLEGDTESRKFWTATPELASWLVYYFSEESLSYEPTEEELQQADIAYWQQRSQELQVEREKKIQELEQKILILQKENQNLKNRIVQVDNGEFKSDFGDQITQRQFYRILIVWWGSKVNKAYMNLQKHKPDFLEPFGLHWRQLELKGDYDVQQDKKFAKTIEDGLLLWKINFVIALQTDHESPFAKLIENPEVWSRITVFAEREWENNPAFVAQRFSQDRFAYYLKRAMEKYEREVENTRNSLW